MSECIYLDECVCVKRGVKRMYHAGVDGSHLQPEDVIARLDAGPCSPCSEFHDRETLDGLIPYFFPVTRA